MPRATSAGTPTQTLPRAAAQQITLTWQAEDPDGDRLVYNVYFRGEDETQWKLLRANTHDNSITFDADVLADGKYFFRVRRLRPRSQSAGHRARSHPDQRAGDDRQHAARAHDRRGPPQRRHRPHRMGSRRRASALRRCEYSLDATSWVPMESVDGVIDSPREKFALDLTGLAPGEHLLVIRAADSANNTGTAKVVLK